MHRQTLRRCLYGHQPRAEQCGCGVSHLGQTVYAPHTTRLAAPTRVHLRLDDPALTAQPPGDGESLLNRGGERALSGGYRGGGQQLLGLVFVQVHIGAKTLFWGKWRIYAKMAMLGL